MTRKVGWEKRFFAVMVEWRDKPFKWGAADCMSFALAAGAAARGEPIGPHLDMYSDALGARRVLHGLGAETLEEALEKYLEPVPVALAQRGDIGIVMNGGTQCAVVNAGTHWMGKTEAGLIRVSGEALLRAFKV